MHYATKLLETTNLPVALGIAGFILAVIFGSPVIAQFVQNRGKRNFRKKTGIQKVDLLNHALFDFLDYSLKVRIKQLDFNCEFKNNVFRDFLMVQFRVFRDNLYSYVKHYSQSQTAHYVFKMQMLYLLYNSLEQCEKQWKQLKVPQINFIAEQFSKWNSIAFEFIQKYTCRTLNSNIYDNDTERLNAIIDLYITAFEIVLLDVESALNKVNGRYEGLTYKSIYS